MKLRTILAAATVAALSTPAFADDAATVTAFYDLLGNPGSEEYVAAFKEATSENWESVGNYSGENKTREAFLGQIGGFSQLIPNLDWAVQDMYVADGFVTVRSRAKGTPVAPFFGVDGQGRSFDIMAIDVHQLEDGKIIRTYHVEDWAGGIQQLSGH